jgi:hypothetical protein
MPMMQRMQMLPMLLPVATWGWCPRGDWATAKLLVNQPGGGSWLWSFMRLETSPPNTLLKQEGLQLAEASFRDMRAKRPSCPLQVVNYSLKYPTTCFKHWQSYPRKYTTTRHKWDWHSRENMWNILNFGRIQLDSDFRTTKPQARSASPKTCQDFETIWSCSSLADVHCCTSYKKSTFY